MTDADFLDWMADRLVNVYKESPNVDFVMKLREIAKRTRKNSKEMSDIATRMDNIIDIFQKRIDAETQQMESALTLLNRLRGV